MIITTTTTIVVISSLITCGITYPCIKKIKKIKKNRNIKKIKNKIAKLIEEIEDKEQDTNPNSIPNLICDISIPGFVEYDLNYDDEDLDFDAI